LDIDLADADGRVCVRLQGLEFLRIATEAVPTPVPAAKPVRITLG
jgi:hypothetical protein